MLYTYLDSKTGGCLQLHCKPVVFQQPICAQKPTRLLTIAWNLGPTQSIQIDGCPYSFPAHSVVPLMMNQSFTVTQPETIVAWQFDREFYCIVDHDQEVSCVGFLFFGSQAPMFIQLDTNEIATFDALLRVFYDEFSTQDGIQGEMLRMLLKRLIIKLTRLGKAQYLSTPATDTELRLVRQFNVLVETHYRTLHAVSDYAQLLHKSPKTLANVFALYQQPGPLQIIHQRIAREAKRMLLYTSHSAKEIAFALGFEEVAHFSRFFKKETGLAPTHFKEQATDNGVYTREELITDQAVQSLGAP